MVYPILQVVEKYISARLVESFCFLGEGGVDIDGIVASCLGFAPLRQ
jgi:hypothetical protein